jgi:hypothetical protein
MSWLMVCESFRMNGTEVGERTEYSNLLSLDDSGNPALRVSGGAEDTSRPSCRTRH